MKINSRFQAVQCCEKVFDPTLFLISKLEKDNQSKFKKCIFEMIILFIKGESYPNLALCEKLIANPY